jgi:Fic family protein
MRIPAHPPDTLSLVASMMESQGGLEVFARIIGSGIAPAPDGTYRHWDTLRHLNPPQELTVEQWWVGIKFARRSIAYSLPLRDTKGHRFSCTTPDIMQRMLSEIDRDASGAIRGNEQITNPHTRDTYIFKSLVEEAITSSQLEGASTTREIARQMIQSGREPLDRSEQMILNNYMAMRFIQRVKDLPLTPSIIMELHTILTERTLDKPDAAGRFRREDENICVEDVRTGEVLHSPPPAGELKERMDAMCAFANDLQSKEYIHPVVRAIFLHFWLAYDHPFYDGNGRTARALFYWSMARQEYWLCEFLSISRILKEAPARYTRSFLYTETDENDATYFILNQLDVLLRAIRALHDYLQRKTAEMLEVRKLLQKAQIASAMFNHRQLSLLNHALRNPYYIYSVESHQRSHDVSYHTARTDLLSLAEHGLLDHYKVGRLYQFSAPPDLSAKIQRLTLPQQEARKPGKRRSKGG